MSGFSLSRIIFVARWFVKWWYSTAVAGASPAWVAAGVTAGATGRVGPTSLGLAASRAAFSNGSTGSTVGKTRVSFAGSGGVVLAKSPPGAAPTGAFAGAGAATGAGAGEGWGFGSTGAGAAATGAFTGAGVTLSVTFGAGAWFTAGATVAVGMVTFSTTLGDCSSRSIVSPSSSAISKPPHSSGATVLSIIASQHLA